MQAPILIEKNIDAQYYIIQEQSTQTFILVFR